MEVCLALDEKRSRRVVEPAGGTPECQHTHATWALWREKDRSPVDQLEQLSPSGQRGEIREIK